MILFKNPLQTVAELHQTTTLDVDTQHANRYCIRLNSLNGKESYFFSSPIYNAFSRKLVQRNFYSSGTEYRFFGSNCSVSVSETQICLRKNDQLFLLSFPRKQTWEMKEGNLQSADYFISPSCNGICLCGETDNLQFGFSVQINYRFIRTSQNCLCWMEDKFKPTIVVSALVSERMSQKKPLLIRLTNATDSSGTLSFESQDPLLRKGWLEINFYESKLIQDTPVSTMFPNENNAFGPIAFIGKSTTFGIQFLYTRLDTLKMQEILSNSIQELKLYIPYISSGSCPPELFGLTSRFCSFGSTWSNKVDISENSQLVTVEKHFLCLNLTPYYTNRARLTESVGTVLIPARSWEPNYFTISTGDCCTMPQILYVKH